LIVRQIAGEVIVYDCDLHRAHCLNRAAGIVFRHCDGETDIEELAQLLRAETGAPADEGSARLAVDELGKAGLLDGPPGDRGSRSGSRRQLLRQASLVSAALLPLVSTLTVPAAAQTAATCVASCAGEPAGQPCGLGCAFTCDGSGSCI
jgi:hypothetical protein